MKTRILGVVLLCMAFLVSCRYYCTKRVEISTVNIDTESAIRRAVGDKNLILVNRSDLSTAIRFRWYPIKWIKSESIDSFLSLVPENGIIYTSVFPVLENRCLLNSTLIRIYVTENAEMAIYEERYGYCETITRRDDESRRKIQFYIDSYNDSTVIFQAIIHIQDDTLSQDLFSVCPDDKSWSCYTPD